ncbi:hypothetical protein [Burkholderia oklahomensis]|uniref:Uncharacterized protein n=1 Tax=Burkholderia oklahomensis TaxID=342113 RepID=A0AAI8FQG4_9BURK|nr:hypothetical protein [Burkholderia oklahomensis]AIO68847.1 hypothetical protein DM82_4333 [Burkholderia oklahomensis]QPS39508.1 hypothetical protein I6G57_27095 [Burkholderia oklahomensis]
MQTQDHRRATLTVGDKTIDLKLPVPVRVGDAQYEQKLAFAVAEAVLEHFDTKEPQ